MRSSPFAFIFISLIACGGRAATPGAAAQPSAPATDDPGGATAEGPPAPARPAWESPGGMWLPEQLAPQRELLASLGLAIDPAGLADPSLDPLGAIASLGGCSASFVSKQGLLVTNHHCVTGALQHVSTPEQNYAEEGFLAATMADERSVGPKRRVFVTTGWRDVTAEMMDGLDAIADDLARGEELERRRKQVLAACEAGKAGVRCSLADFFAGGRWLVYTQLEIRDVRLVYAPARAVGNFGGEVDNWRWPRHAGDFAMYRAYVGPDGQPADFAAENVPYQPKHTLKLARAPLSLGDLVLCAGFPGKTKRLATAAEAEEQVAWALPRRIDWSVALLALLEELTRGDQALAIKAEPTRRYVNNYLTKSRGLLEALGAGGLVEARRAEEQALLAWIDADPARQARYRPAYDAVAAIAAERAATREADAQLKDLVGASDLLESAMTIVAMAEERGKPDGERDEAYQERNWRKLEAGLVAVDAGYARKLDRAILGFFVARSGEIAPVARLRDHDQALDALYARTTLEDQATRLKLFRSATPKSLANSKDPFIKLALALRPLEKARDDRERRLAGAEILPRRLLVEAMVAHAGGLVAPDANGTLRVTYGTVKGPPGGGDAFTWLPGMVAKATKEPPFDAPADVLAAAAAAPAPGEIPVDFLSDVDTTNGSSGSATLNGRGELVGLLFDGTYESVASDWMYMPKVTRSIHVDVRYLLWMLDAVEGGQRLLLEMGL